jgi:Protein of unknown function with HXXEE motif
MLIVFLLLNLVTFLNHMPFLTVIWLLPIALALHEAEEWNILPWEQRNFVDLPAKTYASVRTFLAFFTLFGFLWTALAALLNNPTIAAFIILLLAAGGFLNALQHLFYTIYFREYAPGIITSVALYLPISGYLTARAIQENLVPVVYVGALGIVVILCLIQTMKAGNTFIPAFRAVSHIGMALSKWLHIFQD